MAGRYFYIMRYGTSTKKVGRLGVNRLVIHTSIYPLYTCNQKGRKYGNCFTTK